MTTELYTLVTLIMFLLICLQKSEFGCVVFLRASYLENVVALILMEKHTVFITSLPVFPY